MTKDKAVDWKTLGKNYRFHNESKGCICGICLTKTKFKQLQKENFELRRALYATRLMLKNKKLKSK